MFSLHERIVAMIYQITVQGCVEPSWSDWFDGMEITNETTQDAQSITTFTSNVDDQATLRGILNRIWDLNLIVLSVIRVESKISPLDRTT